MLLEILIEKLKENKWEREDVRKPSDKSLVTKNFYVTTLGEKKITLGKFGEGKKCIYVLNVLTGEKSDKLEEGYSHSDDPELIKNTTWLNNPNLIEFYTEISKSV